MEEFFNSYLPRMVANGLFEEERFESCRFVPLLGRFGWKEEA